MITSTVGSTASHTDHSRAALLVVVPDGMAAGQPRVFLADSEQQTELERIFTCGPDVVRVPHTTALSVSPLRQAAPVVASAGEQALLAAVLHARSRHRASSWASALQPAVPLPRAGSATWIR